MASMDIIANPTDRARGDQLESELAASLYAPPAESSLELAEAAATIRQMVLGRMHRGTGGLLAWFPLTVQAWRAVHTEDDSLDELSARFCASRFAKAWRELSFGELGMSMEEALYRFFADAQVGDPEVCEEEFLGALVRGLAIAPAARFHWPSQLRAAPGGCQAVSSRGVLHAAIDGQYLCGPVTSAIRDILDGKPDGNDVVVQSLRARRLIK